MDLEEKLSNICYDCVIFFDFSIDLDTLRLLHKYLIITEGFRHTYNCLRGLMLIRDWWKSRIIQFIEKNNRKDSSILSYNDKILISETFPQKPKCIWMVSRLHQISLTSELLGREHLNTVNLSTVLIVQVYQSKAIQINNVLHRRWPRSM